MALRSQSQVGKLRTDGAVIAGDKSGRGRRHRVKRLAAAATAQPGRRRRPVGHLGPPSGDQTTEPVCAGGMIAQAPRTDQNKSGCSSGEAATCVQWASTNVGGQKVVAGETVGAA